MKTEKPFKNEIPCECGDKKHKAGLIVGKWGSLEEGIIESKVKIQIFEGDEIKSVVVSKKKLIKALEFREQGDSNYIQIMSLIPKVSTVLDLGCGAGHPFIGTEFPILIGVDVWKRKFYMPEYDQVWFHDIRKILELYPQKFFDVLTCIDVIEHLEKEEGFKLMEDAEKIAWNKVIIFTPKKWSENKESVENKSYWSYGNKYNYHKSHWTEKDFTDRGYKIIPNEDYILAKKELR